jgi:peptidyl-prolyl cis-trans isomerase C
MVLAACGFALAEAPVSPDAAPAAVTAPSPARPAPETVLAKVGDREIREKDVDDILATLDPQRAAMYDTERGRKAVLDEVITMEVFSLWGKENDVEKDPEFSRALDAMRKDLVRSFAVKRLFRDVAVSDQDAKMFYDKNQSAFAVPESVKVSHVLVKEEAEAKKVLDEIKGGLAFEEAAKKYSSCPSKEQGGDLGYIQKGQTVPEFETVAFALKKDEMSAPVKTQFGWHVIKLFDRKAPGTKPFADVKDEIKTELLKDKKTKLYTDEVAKLREKYKVEVVSADVAPKK